MLSQKKKQTQILLVEDEPELREMIKTKLERDYKVLSCEKVSEAVLKLKNQQFDLIILDIRLPDGTGEQIIESIRKNNEKGFNEKTPILVTSGHVDSYLLENIRGQISGAIVKPFDYATLKDRLQKIFEQHPPGSTAK